MLMQTQRMEAERVRRNEESDRRNIQQRTVTVQKTWDERKELARQATKQYLAHFKRDTLDFLTEIGVLRRWSDYSFGYHFMPLFNNQILIEYYGMDRRDQEMTLLLKDSATKQTANHKLAIKKEMQRRQEKKDEEERKRNRAAEA